MGCSYVLFHHLGFHVETMSVGQKHWLMFEALDGGLFVLEHHEAEVGHALLTVRQALRLHHALVIDAHVNHLSKITISR